MNCKKMLAAGTAFSLAAVSFAEDGQEEFSNGVFQWKLLQRQAQDYLNAENLIRVATAVISVVVFYAVYRVIRSLIRRGTEKRLEPHTAGIIAKFVSYTFYVIIGIYILSLFGIKVSALLGAAGVAGLAIGFAAQTSVSNVISGLFVLTEKTMKIGDFIEVDGVSGTVDDIGLLSVKIRTLDNQLIRIPNSTIINTKLMNYATFDLRRFSFQLEVSYEYDLRKALAALMTVPERCPSVIKDDPDHAPIAVYSGMGDTGMEVSLNVWFKRQDLFDVKNEVFIAYAEVCNENPDIDFAYKRIDISVLSEDTSAPRSSRSKAN